MSRSITVPVSHNLPKDEVRRRMRERVGGLGKYIPGGNSAVQSSWPSEDRMRLDITAMGQNVEALLDVQDTAVMVTVQLPGMLGMMAGMIEGSIKDKGSTLLLGDERKDKDKTPR